MNNIILVDDDANFINSFKNEAFAKGITVSPKNSLEGLKQLLPIYAHKYAAVVLDIKCLLKDGQAKEDASFITAALKYLDSNIPGFPRFILTGDETEFDTLKKYYTDEKMFIKKPDDQVKLLDQLIFCVQNAEPLRLKRENPLIFVAFDRGFLPANKEQTVLNIFKNYNEMNSTNFRGIIGDAREVHEEIYKSLNSRNKSVVPDRYINGNGSPKFTGDFYNHLQGNPDRNNGYAPTTPIYQDSTISSTTKFIHQTCSEFLHGTSKTHYPINHYTIKALINGVMELIIWSTQF
jgi:hypothetical protein